MNNMLGMGTQPSLEVTRQPQVARRLDQLRNVVNGAEERLSFLLEKLSPVLRCEPGAPHPVDKDEAQVPVAESMGEIVRRIEAINRELESAIERLEV